MVLNTAYWPDWLKIIQVFEQVFRTVSFFWNNYFSKVIATFPSPKWDARAERTDKINKGE